MRLANTLALQQAGVDTDTPDVVGGEIIRDEDGRLTGILKDNAMLMVQKAIPEPTERQLDAWLDAAMQYVAGHGVTTVHDMSEGVGDGWAGLETYRRTAARGDLITRIYAVTPLAEWRMLAAEIEQNGHGDEWLKTGGVKGFMDGSVGSHTAAMLEPFTDTPD